MSQETDLSVLDDFAILEERRRIMATLAGLVEKYKQLNDEMRRRDTLRWMTAP